MASKDITANIHLLQEELNSLSTWAKNWFVIYNPPKTDFMLISLRLNKSLINLTFDDLPIAQVDHHTHLG
jgi:hypothetical protein